jgi:hypothetical protein
MSASTYITFLKDQIYHKEMVEALRHLYGLDVKNIPKEFVDYFGTEDIEEAINKDTEECLEVESVTVDTSYNLPNYVRKADTDSETAIEIDIAKLPANVKHIRVARF